MFQGETIETSRVSRRDTWVDHEGYVHERRPGASRRVTRCALDMGPNNPAPPARACGECVEEALKEYALNHDCHAESCATRSA